MIMLLIIFVLGVLVVGVVIAAVQDQKSEKAPGLVAQQAQEKGAHKQKIVDALGEKPTLTNNDVQELVSVSDATATRYLDELEKEGTVRQPGGHYRQEGVLSKKVGNSGNISTAQW